MHQPSARLAGRGMMTDQWSAENQPLGFRNLRGDRVVDPTPSPGEPKRLGRYQIVGELGRGAMGMVYKSHDPRIDRVVAIKIITIAAADPTEAEAYRTRFIREAQAAGRLSHPGIVTIFDVDQDPISGTPYIVMEYVPGKRLDTFVAAQPTQRLPLETSLALAQQIAEALDYAHGQNIVHRDIKPGNVIVAEEGYAKIADFGIAKISLTDLTLPGQVLGTPSFMAPEQFLGNPVDGRSDLFSLGVILYWMLTGVKPFAGESATSVSFKLVYQEPTPPTQIAPTLHPYFDAVLQRALAKDPAARYQSGSEFAQDLKLLRRGDPPKAMEAFKKSTGKAVGQRAGRTLSAALKSVAARSTQASNRFLQQFVEQQWWSKAKQLRPKWQLALAAFGLLIAAIGIQRVVVLRKASSMQEDFQISKSMVETDRTVPAATAIPEPVPRVEAGHKSVREHPARRAQASRGKVALHVAAENARALPKLQPSAATQSGDAVQPIDLEPATNLNSTVTESSAKIESSATLLTIGEHPFRSASLSISVDGQLAYRGLLTGARKLPFGGTHGEVSTAIRLSPGSHVVEVHVVSERDHFDETEKIEGQLQANQIKILIVAFAGHSSDMRLAWK